MNNYKSILRILGKNQFSTDQNIIRNYATDWRGEYVGDSNLVVFPDSLQKISEIIKICQRESLSIVPQGGNTGLVGGGVPRTKKNEIILNLSKINKIREIDLLGNSVTVEGGCVLEDIKKKLFKFDREFPLSMGSKGSCQIGGNIATNAGGLNVIKYGTIRQNILGIEAVLPNGEIYSSLKNIKKNNTGLDLKQLLIGSEGILGIITAAMIQIYPLPKEKIVIWASLNKFKEVLKLYVLILNKFKDLITSFEFMNKGSIEVLEKHELKLGNLKRNECYCLIEISNFNNIENFSDFISSNISLQELNFDEFIISKSESENKKFWSYRECIPLAERKEKFIIAHDISVPLSNIQSFIQDTSKEIKKFDKFSKIINFGHLGDNNLHFNVLINSYELSKKNKIKKSVNRIVFDNVNKFGGAISAEHGIGQLRKKELTVHKSRDEIKLMKKIKKLFDPRNILNPGKVI